MVKTMYTEYCENVVYWVSGNYNEHEFPHILGMAIFESMPTPTLSAPWKLHLTPYTVWSANTPPRIAPNRPN